MEDYENLSELVKVVKKRGFKTVSIQSRDVNRSIELCNYLQDLFKGLEVKFYVLGDVLTGSCCIDLIAAKRLHTDCIVYVGEGCYFELDTDVHIHYLFSRVKLDFNQLQNKITELCNKVDDGPLLLIYDGELYPHVEDIARLFLDQSKVLYVAHPQTLFNSSNDSNSEDNGMKWCNRIIYHYSSSNNSPLAVVTGGSPLTYNTVVYINLNESLLNTIQLTNINKPIYSLSAPLTDKTTSPTLTVIGDGTDVVMKRYKSIEAAREAKSLGIICLSKQYKLGNELRRLLQRVVQSKGRHCYLFCINELTEMKLLNFPRIDLYVLIGCNLTFNSLAREVARMVITPYELLVALEVTGWSDYIFPHDELIVLIKDYLKDNDKATKDGEGQEETVTDQKSGPSPADHNGKPVLLAKKEEELRNVVNMELSERFANLMERVKINDQRTFQGVGDKFEPEQVKLVKGSFGTPSKYDHELSNEL